MTEMEVGNDGAGPSVSMGALFVRALLDRRGVARHRQATLIAEILGLSYAQAHRRLGSGGGGSAGGGAPWTIDDVARVAQHFGESLSDMVASGAGGAAGGADTGATRLQDEQGSVAADFAVEGLRWPCRAWIGDPVEVVPPGSLVAVTVAAGAAGGVAAAVASSVATSVTAAANAPNLSHDQAPRLPAHSTASVEAPLPQWEIWPAGHLPARPQVTPLHAVRRVVIVPEQARRYRVAVLDDDRDVADSLSEQFREAGLAAQAFYSPQELSTVLTVQPFDAYVLDWILGKDTALSLVKAIRAADPHCPIAMLTGQLISKRADEGEVVAAMQTWSLMFYEKPVRAFIVAAALKQALALALKQAVTQTATQATQNTQASPGLPRKG